MRQVRYYLEDDTVDVTEPKQLNSGLPQVPLFCWSTRVRQACMATDERSPSDPAQPSSRATPGALGSA